MSSDQKDHIRKENVCAWSAAAHASKSKYNDCDTGTFFLRSEKKDNIIIFLQRKACLHNMHIRRFVKHSPVNHIRQWRSLLWSEEEDAGFIKGLPQSPRWLRIVQVLQGFQRNLDKDRNTLKVNSRESAQLLIHLLLINLHRVMVDTKAICVVSLKRCSTGLTKEGYVRSRRGSTCDVIFLIWQMSPDVIWKCFSCHWHQKLYCVPIW